MAKSSPSSQLTYVFSTLAADAVDELRPALGPRFTVEIGPGPGEYVQKTWIDTFDWRLHAAGVTLEYVDQGPLTGHFPQGAQLHSALPKRTWPAHADDLPAGPLRDTLAPLIAPRALLPVAAVRCFSCEGRILNADEKTVARLVVEKHEDGATRLVVRPLRGYEPDADWISDRLAGLDGFVGVTTTPFAEALASAHRRPDNYDKSPTVPLSPQTPAGVALVAVLQHFQAAITENLVGTIEAVDTEFLHDLRVAVRRTRSVLKLTGDVLPADLTARFAPEFKWLGDLTTPVRDLDVYLLGFDAMASGLVSAEPAELDPFRSFLLRERTAERRSLVRGLQSRRFLRLMDEWSAALAEASDSAAAGVGGLTIAALARQRVGRVLRRVARQGEQIAIDSPGEKVHALRKRCKELRYLLEVFRPLCEATVHRTLVKHLKAVQDTLGDFQDGEVQRNAVRQFAATMLNTGVASSETLLAMGELAAQLDAQQIRARAVLPDRLLPFVAEAYRTRVKTLVLQ